MFDRERLALDPGALETNRAGLISKGQRSMLRARATGALLGLFGTGAFAVSAWWVAMTGGARVWLAIALIATVAAPIVFWAFDLIRADLRSGRVVEVTDQAIVTAEDQEDHVLWVRLRGHRIRVPFAAAGIVRQSGDVTAYYTLWSKTLVNLAPAISDE
ncbi:MAG TPA: hypothetical protein VN906_02090 [Candidatus Sulfotelmatobacter sp.]|nr:hypothetical protein [Candidatus Sulfotelmatobacter sp.]